jgi:hypothetical protein
VTLLIVQLVQGLRWKTWTFTFAVGVGCIAKVIGKLVPILQDLQKYYCPGCSLYGPRHYAQQSLVTSWLRNANLLSHYGPAFLAAGVYLLLKHFTITFGAVYSCLQPKCYTWIFISWDFLSLVLQAAGGATAATANTEKLTVIGGHAPRLRRSSRQFIP